MQWQEPHLAYQLILQIFRQADLRQPHRRHATHKPPSPSPPPPSSVRPMAFRARVGALRDHARGHRLWRYGRGGGAPARRSGALATSSAAYKRLHPPKNARPSPRRPTRGGLGAPPSSGRQRQQWRRRG